MPSRRQTQLLIGSICRPLPDLPQLIQVISPRLHHASTLRKMLSEVVRRAHGVALAVGELTLDCVAIPALFVEQGANNG